MSYLIGFAEKYELPIRFKTTVKSVIKKESGGFLVTDRKGNHYSTRCLIVATGIGKPYLPPIPGIEHAEGYESVSMRRDDFKDQRVLIIGKGNSGFEFAEHILDSAKLVHLAGPSSIRMAWNTRHAGDLRAHYTRLMDAYQLKMLHGVLDCTLDKIEKRSDGKFAVTITYTHAQGERECIVYDRIVRATGFRIDDSIFNDGAQPDLIKDGRLPDMTSSWESTNVPDMFFAGTLMQARDFRKAASPFIDGFRYNIRTLYHLLEKRYYGRPLPSDDVAIDPANIANMVLRRICRSSALWAQFGFLCDAIVIDERAGTATHFAELPVDYVHESELGQSSRYFTITFEWGQWDGDVFRIERHPTHADAQLGAFLHPIVRSFCKGRIVAEHHVLEDLLGMYCAVGETGTVESRNNRDINSYHLEEHELPLRRFFETQVNFAAKQLGAD